MGVVSHHAGVCADLRRRALVTRPAVEPWEVVHIDPRLELGQEDARSCALALDAAIVNGFLPTFSRAISASKTGPTPVRSAQDPDGYPWAIGKSDLAAQAGNFVRNAVMTWCETASTLGIPWILFAPEQLDTTQTANVTASPW